MVGIADAITNRYQVGDDIIFGPIKIIYVRPGTLKFAMMRNTGKPMLLGPGLHYFNDLNLSLGKEISMNFHGDNQTVFCDDAGGFQFVFVKTGSAAVIISRDGALGVRGPGLHFVQAPDALKTFVSIQQEHFKFGTVDTKQNFLTADNIELKINATVFYRITDVTLMFTTRISNIQDLAETLHAQAMATLLTIIRSEDFQGIGKAQQTREADKKFKDHLSSNADSMNGVVTVSSATPSAPSAPGAGGKSAAINNSVMEKLTMGFQNIIHDAEPQFQRMMQHNFGGSGIEIQSLRIEQIEFADPTMQKQVSEFAMTNTKLISQQQTISAQRAIQVAEAERDAAALTIKTKNATDLKIMQTEAENEIKIRTAKAEAQNKLIIAEAEAMAKLKVGEAELQIMERQNAMPFAQLRIVADAQRQALAGVQKVIYTDQQSLLMKPFFNIPDLTDAK